jgi:hypothetical protein
MNEINPARMWKLLVIFLFWKEIRFFIAWNWKLDIEIRCLSFMYKLIDFVFLKRIGICFLWCHYVVLIRSKNVTFVSYESYRLKLVFVLWFLLCFNL